MFKLIFNALIVVILTVLTQLGGIAWLVGLCFRRRILTFLAAYTALSLTAMWIAPSFGRVPLSCTSDGALQVQSKLYCLLNRHYATPDLKEALADLATEMDRTHPGTITVVLDANFPFVDDFPLLPHLSHDDGQKADLAFYYKGEDGYLPGATKSPIGYFAFEQGPSDCPKTPLSLRWDMGWLQSAWPQLTPEPSRMTAALTWLSNDARIGKVFIEPHLKARFGVQSGKIRFQGCRAARHDDHIHIQL